MSNPQSKFHCRHCALELGATDGLRLFIAVVIGGQVLTMEFHETTRPHCPACGKPTPWIRPKSQEKISSCLERVVVV